MNKLFVLICFILSALPCFAEYLPMSQYKADMEEIIKNNIKKGYTRVNKDVALAKNYRDNIIKYKLSSSSNECINLDFTFDFIMSDALLDIYSKLITGSKKYFKIDETYLATDYWGGLASYIEPYLKKYNVNTIEIDKLTNYTKRQEHTIINYIKDTEHFCHILENQPQKFTN